MTLASSNNMQCKPLQTKLDKDLKRGGVFGSLVFAFSQTALIPDHSFSHIFTLQKHRPHLSFTTCYQPRGRTIQLCHTLISAVRLSLSRNGSKHHAWRSRRISHSSTHTSLSYASNHFSCQHVPPASSPLCDTRDTYSHDGKRRTAYIYSAWT